MDQFRIVQLKNRTHSVHSVAHGETFHPVVGPVIEAEALYVNQLHLPDRIASHPDGFVIWDVGLGAAANAVTVLRAARNIPATVQIVSFDCTVAPLEFALRNVAQLDFLTGYEAPLEDLITHKSTQFAVDQLKVDWTLHLGDFPTLLETGSNKPTDEPAPVGGPTSPKAERAFRNNCFSDSEDLVPPPPGSWPQFTSGFSKVFPPHEPAWSPGSSEGGTTRKTQHSGSLPVPHAILFDAFSPAKNPAMWCYSVFRGIFERLRPEIPCSLATYSRSTLLRVTLLLAGFFVGTGRATGEKEETTIAANVPELIEAPLDRLWLKRARNSTSAEPLWNPSYRQERLTEASLQRLLQHPQFA